jgi:hypothetical protein
MYTTEPCLNEPSVESFEREEWSPEMGFDPSDSLDEEKTLRDLEIFAAVNLVLRASRDRLLTNAQILALMEEFEEVPF